MKNKPKPSSCSTAKSPPRSVKKCRRVGTRCIWPKGVEDRYGINAVTRWRWERDKKLPSRDVFINGAAVGWRPETLESADRREVATNAH